VKLPISVIAVVFNARRQLESTAQALQEFSSVIDEFIVVDGASNDGTSEYIAREPAICSWISEPDNGIYDAMNKGWAMAKSSNHILFLGAGDKILSLPLHSELEKNVVLYGDVRLENCGTFIGRSDCRLMLGNTLHHQALLVPKSLHPDPPFNCHYPIYADYDFSLRLLKRGVRFKKSPSFVGYAAAAGASRHLNEHEMSQVVASNYGPFAKIASRVYLRFQNLKRAWALK
jgi:glycosyltransferase involved in cell wall biosynthesis